MKTQYVDVKDMMDAREKRAYRQRMICENFNGILISYTMNIAGPIKNSKCILDAFLDGLCEIHTQLKLNDIPKIYQEEYHPFTGNEALILVNKDPLYIKHIMTEIEESHPLGRLFDIDVIRKDGTKVERQEIGEEPRKCLICNDVAANCASRRRHNLEEIQKTTIEMIYTYLADKFAKKIAEFALRGLLYEVAVTPKPGLVDRNNQGSHKDMNFYTFIDSAVVLRPYFESMVQIGMKTAQEEGKVTFKKLQQQGKKAEMAMLKATKDVNTHKGAIFSLGILCGALGRTWKPGFELSVNAIFEECIHMTEEEIERFFNQMDSSMTTAGCRLFQQYGIKGVRGEVASGFPAVKNVGLPLLKRLLDKGFSKDEAGSIVLISLFLHSTDTNVIARSNYETFKEMKEKLSDLIQKNEEPSRLQLEMLDEEFIEKNLSPGGSADLLAVCWFLLFIETV